MHAQLPIERCGLMRMPADDATEWDWLRFTQSGTVTWAQASAVFSPAKVRHLVATGRWWRACRGVLVTYTGQLEPATQLWIAVLAAGPGAVLAGLAAANAAGLRYRSRRRDAIDVLVPESCRAPKLLRQLPLGMPAVFVRRTRNLPTSDRQRAHPPRTVIGRSVVDAAQWAESDLAAQTVIAAGCQQRLVEPAEILAAAQGRRLRRGTLIRQTAHDLAGGPDALSEVDLARLCRRFGLPAPVHQERRTDASGRVRYLDASWPRWRLQVEVDGAHHLEVGQWEADMRRQNDLWLEGERLLRFSAFQTRHRPAEVAAQIERALRTAGWAGEPSDR